MNGDDRNRSATKTADKKKSSNNKIQRRRNGLLALVHIAKKKLALRDDEYRDVLKYWGVKTSAEMSIPELEELVEYFESLGFKKKVSADRDLGSGVGQIKALQERVRAEARKLNNGEQRLKGLVKKIAKAEDLMFCRDVKKLKQILKVVRLLLGRE
ncbi:MAG: phage protein GemA/Gp16 family protein [Desulfobacterales bacterium]